MTFRFKVLLFPLILSCFAPRTFAHISYTNLMVTDPVHNAFGNAVTETDGSITYNFRGSVAGNAAWADAADENWGDSHSVLPWEKFEVDSAGGAYVSISISGGISGYVLEWDEAVQDVRPKIQDGKLDLTPAFTLYSGLLPELAHDSSEVLPPPEGKEGRWNALGDVTMANDDGDIGTVKYLMHAGEVDSGSSTVSLDNIFLPKGVYSMAIGGACSACILPELTDEIGNDPLLWEAYLALENDSFIQRGYTVSLNIRPVPVPPALPLMATGLLGIFGVRRFSLRN